MRVRGLSLAGPYTTRVSYICSRVDLQPLVYGNYDFVAGASVSQVSGHGSKLVIPD